MTASLPPADSSIPATAKTVEDLTKETQLSYPSPALQPYNQQRAHDRVRATIAGIALGVLVVLSTASFVAVLMGYREIDDVAKLHGFALAPWFGLTGTVLGFYFAGGRSSAQ